MHWYENVLLFHTLIDVMANNTTTRVTISLPAAMVKAADRQGRLELRNRSEMMREALRHYLARVSTDEATQAEIAAFKRGKAEIARGDYVTLTQLRHDMDSHRHEERT
jgi:metal-responsive CopG/Arc/MetJ family transcriptional regulator